MPYPIESAPSVFSGMGPHVVPPHLRVPEQWGIGRNRLKLHFGAVDYAATVCERMRSGSRGRLRAFSADVTDAGTARTTELVVGVTDLTDATRQPVGKQRRVPDRGIF